MPDEQDVPRVTVVHLALKSYGAEPLARFVASYREYPAGVDHRLILALKGFRDLVEAQPFIDLLAGVPHEALLVPDKGLDIGTYIRVAHAVDADYLCFFNSRSVIRADHWLAGLLDAVRQPGVGVSGATASFQGIASDRWRAPRKRSWRMLRWVKRVLTYPHMVRLYPTFPNPHIRTNAFVIRRDLFLSLDLPHIRTKSDAMRFESGRHGLTRQLIARGLRPLLVDRNGNAHEVDDWPTTEIFWRGDQRDLSVADNQTELFADLDPTMRDWHTGHAWRPVR